MYRHKSYRKFFFCEYDPGFILKTFNDTRPIKQENYNRLMREPNKLYLQHEPKPEDMTVLPLHHPCQCDIVSCGREVVVLSSSWTYRQRRSWNCRSILYRMKPVWGRQWIPGDASLGPRSLRPLAGSPLTTRVLIHQGSFLCFCQIGST